MVVLVLPVLAVAGCTSGPATVAPPTKPTAPRSTAPVTPTTSPPSRPPTAGGVALGTPPCPVELPESWRRARSEGEIWHGVWGRYAIQAPTPEGSGVLTQRDEGSAALRISVLGRGRRVVEDYGAIPHTPGQLAQITTSVIDRDRLAFVVSLTNGEEAAWRWRLYLGDRRTHQLKLVTSNPVNEKGRPRPGGWVQPVLTDRYLYWIQAAPDTTGGWGGSELMQYALGSGTTRRLYRGLAEAFVPYRDIVLFTALRPGTKPPGGGPATGIPEVVLAVRQDDGTPVPAPPGIDAGDAGANAMTTDGDLVVWSSYNGSLRAWRAEWGRSITLVPDPTNWPAGSAAGLVMPLTTPRIFGRFLAFRGGDTFVLDLRSNAFVRLTSRASGMEMSGSWMQFWELTSENSINRETHDEQSNQYLLDLGTASGLPRCPS